MELQRLIWACSGACSMTGVLVLFVSLLRVPCGECLG